MNAGSGALRYAVPFFVLLLLVWVVSNLMEDEEAPGITLVIAPIGGGKGMYLAWMAFRTLEKGREWRRRYARRGLKPGDVLPLRLLSGPGMVWEVYRRWRGQIPKTVPPEPRLYADYWVAGARPWLDWSYIATPAGSGGTYLADELGSTFSARSTLDLDKAHFFAGSMMRHMHSRVIGCAQHIAFIDPQWRRLCGTVVVVSRIGPDGKWALLTGSRSLLMRPWYFVARHYSIVDFDDSGNLLPTAKCSRVEFLRWKREVAELYSTTAMMIPPELQERWRTICSEARAVRELPVMSADLTVNDVFVGDRADLRVPELVSGRKNVVSRPREARVIAASRGLYDDPELREVVGG